MIIRALEFLLGLALAVSTLRDVFDTVVVPGASHGRLKVVQRLVFLTLPAWRWAQGRRGGISTSFAPFALVAAFVVWMVLLILGFGLMAQAIGDQFRPPLASLPQALYVAGAGIVTVGLSGTDALGPARFLVLASGFCGLAVMTMAVTYLLEVQNSIAARDAGILKLTTSAGQPPSGLGLLQRFAELDFKDQIPAVLARGRDWCAEVQQSHLSHPSLIYFRSTGTGAGWPAALGALMDFALCIELLIDAPQLRAPAVLMREEGGRMAAAISDLIGLRHDPRPPTEAELDEVLARLAACGYRLKPAPDRDAFTRLRARHAGCVSRLSSHLGGADAPLAPPV